MKFLLILIALIAGTIVGVHAVLKNGSLLRYLDAHPDSNQVPRVEFLIGEGYYIMGDLQNSATYYQRIAERYPQSAYSDDAYFNYLQTLDDMNTPHLTMADLYNTYLERFPQGNHAEVVHKRYDDARNAR